MPPLDTTSSNSSFSLPHLSASAIFFFLAGTLIIIAVLLFLNKIGINSKDNKNDNIKQKGFTIIELIVVVAIISVMAGIVVANVSQYQSKAKVAWALATINQLEKALEMYKTQYGYYPYQAGSGGDPSSPGGIDAYNCDGNNPTFVSALAPKLAPNFIGGVQDYASLPNSTPCWGSGPTPVKVTPFFEYETDLAGGYVCTTNPSGYTIGGVSLCDAPYVLFVGSPYPIPGLTLMDDRHNYFYFVQPMTK